LARPDRWRSRLRTATAMAAICWARLVVATLPFSRWRKTLGGTAKNGSANIASGEARRLAAHVDWAARLLPFPTKCLPRAMALSWILRSKHIGHCVVFAVRPPEQRSADDQLHAWVEIAGERILGDLPGTWVETLRMGDG
jgi:hypothetical protein